MPWRKGLRYTKREIGYSMKKHIIQGACMCLIGLLFLFSCKEKSEIAQQAAWFGAWYDSIKQVYAPDSRTHTLSLYLSRDTALICTGETNVKEVLDVIEQKMAQNGIVLRLTLLPDKAGLKGGIYGVVNNAVVNIRARPSHRSELVTQALLGMPLRVLKRHAEDSAWYRVQTLDGYLGWLDRWEFVRLGEESFRSWRSKKKIIYTSLTEGLCYAHKELDGGVVSNLVMGNVLLRDKEEAEEGFFRVRYADGRTGYVKSERRVAL